MTQGRGTGSSPWVFVPVLYFLQGVPYALVQTVTTTFFTRMLVPVDVIGHWSSLLTLPWTLKPCWGPLVDLHATKRGWVVACQALIFVGLCALAFCTVNAHWFAAAVVLCALVACASATHDIAADGFYLLALGREDQARHVGLRSAAFRLALIFGTGAVVLLAGVFERRAGAELAGQDGIARAWMIALGAGALLYGLVALVGWFVLPRPAADGPMGGRAGGRADADPALAPAVTSAPPFLEALASYFRQPRIVPILAFILLYRFGESMLTRMAPSFLLGAREKGGLALTTEDVGFMLGTVGVAALILGGWLGGMLIARIGLKRALWPMVIALHLPNLFYVWAAVTAPDRALVGLVIAVEQLGYGFGFSAYLVYLMQISRGHRYQTTHYAISTGLMGLGALLAGYISGDVVAAFGFVGFFVIVCIATVPGMLTLLFIPLDERPPAVARADGAQALPVASCGEGKE